MPATFVGSATGVDTATMPSHQAGDLIVVAAFRVGAATTPSLPAGYTSISTGGNAAAPATALRIGYKIAASGSEAVGTWTGASSLLVSVYRGQSASPIGAVQRAFALTSDVTYPGLTLASASGGSIVAAFGVANSTTSTIEVPPTGTTLRANAVVGTEEVAIFDTNGGVTSWSARTVALGTAMRSGGAALEIKGSPAVVVSAGSTTSAAAGRSIGKGMLLAVVATAAVAGARSCIVTATVAFSAALSKSVSHGFTVVASLGVTASLQAAKALSAGVLGVAFASVLKVRTQAVSVALSTTAAVTRSVEKTIGLTAPLTTSVMRSVMKVSSAAVAGSTVIVKDFGVIVSSAVSSVVSSIRSAAKRLAFSVTAALALWPVVFLSWIPIKVYRAGAWVLGKLRIRRDGQWKKPTLRRFDGSDWVDLD